MVIENPFYRFYKLLICLLLCFLSIVVAYGQDAPEKYPVDRFYLETKGPSPFRVFLSKFKLGISTGYGRTFYSHDLQGFGLLRQPDAGLYLFDGAFTPVDSVPGYTNWFNDAESNGTILADNDFLINSDTARLKMRGGGTSIPIALTLHYEFLKRYRIGGGFTFEYHNLGPFESKEYTDQIGEFRPSFQSGFFKRYYGLVGAKIYRYWDYVLVADAQIGSLNPGGQFNKSIIKRGVYFNIGATIERDFSEIFRAFVRPSFDYKKITLTLPETGAAIKHKMPAFYLTFGVLLGIHPLKKCPVKDCRTQVNHVHGGQEYRSRVFPIYKKQSPHYGENYPKLIKYKGKNKRIRNPY